MTKLEEYLDGMGSGRKLGALLLLIVLLSAVPYRHLVGRGFTDPDDFYMIYRTRTIDLPDPSRILLEPHAGRLYRPVNRLVTAALTATGDGGPAPFLIQNLLLHLVNVGLVFGITWSLASSRWPASLAAMLFAFHPANVNAVSIAVFTYVFSTSLLLFGVYLVARWLSEGPWRNGHTLVFVSVIFIVLTFSGEAYLWVLPTYSLTLLWFRRRGDTGRAYTMALVLAVAGLAGYLLVRQAIVGELGTAILSSGARYGLRMPLELGQNLAMMLVGSGLSLDHLLFVNPAVQTLPTSPGAIVAAPGVLISVGLGLLFTTLTLSAGVWGTVSGTRRNLRLAFAFSILFLLSISIVLVTTTASETHLYTGSALLSIAAGLILFELGRHLFQSSRPHHLIGRWLLVGSILLVLILRAIGVENRNQILVDRWHRSEKLQEHLVNALATCRADEILIISACQVPEGYSVYGGTGLELFQMGGFVELALDDFSVSTEVVELSMVENGQIDPGPEGCAVVVDMEGNVKRYPEKRSEWRCDQGPVSAGAR